MAKFSGLQLNQPIKNLDGIELKKEGTEIPLKVKDALTTVLRAHIPVHQGGPDINEDQKYEMYSLARKILEVPADDTSIILESKDIKLILTRANKWFTVDVYGFLHEVLEGINTDYQTVKN